MTEVFLVYLEFHGSISGSHKEFYRVNRKILDILEYFNETVLETDYRFLENDKEEEITLKYLGSNKITKGNRVMAKMICDSVENLRELIVELFKLAKKRKWETGFTLKDASVRKFLKIDD